MLFYDTHTHRRDSGCNPQVVAIGNCAISVEGVSFIDTQYKSIGVHPSDIQGVGSEWLSETLVSLSQHSGVVALGECGLDKRCGDFITQQQIFRVHVQVASKVGLPMIIHNVRSLSEVLSISRGVGVPRVLHAWGKWDSNIARDHNIYLSLGYRNMGSVEDIPLDRVLLESDDNQSVTIEQVYERFAVARGIEIEELQEIIEHNFKKIFLCR